ncbi:AAA family ATPase [Cellvibrio sp. ARAG 10.3]|jgi:chromosome partitioning protein|uniref:nucleotide-binding protein n=1 Tax=Cellvibrio sp. ARAG 10.3 TaxID=3451358 RepID=UPI003F445CB7
MDTPEQSNKQRSSAEPMVSIQVLNACRILVINGKGGAGKTTVSTNLAAWLAHRGERTVLVDADPQASSHYWVTHRDPVLPSIYSVKIETNSRTTRSFQWRAPKPTRWLITDAPPGLTGPALDDLVQDHDLIVVPVQPSDIDIRASARFIGELLLTQNMRRKRRPIAVVANRVKQQTNAWERLQKFLLSLNIPFPATLRDTQNYVRAYSEGRGIVDYPFQSHARDRQDWEILIRWLDAQNSTHEWLKEDPPTSTITNAS